MRTTQLLKFTSFYWLGPMVEREVINAPSVEAALAFHYQLGWNSYDDRRLVAGDVATEDAAKHPRIVANESWGEES